MCDRYGGWTVFYEVGKENLSLYLDLGLTPLKMGEEARVPLGDFSLEGKSRKSFRHICNRFEKEGYRLEILEAEDVPPMLSTLKTISDAWLKEKNTREKRFSLGSFNPAYLQLCPLGIVRRGDAILAFCNIWMGAAKEELSLDLMRYLPEAPADTMEYLFLQLMLWGKEQGYQWFNLGMAPLSGLDGRPIAPAWNRFGSLLYQHGEHFYNFQGLRQYKEKFDPRWEPRYLACPSGLALPRVLTNIASLVSGGMKGVISK
jgi:phosphatidylglycerol lysyltransferase